MRGATLFSGIGAPECAAPWVQWQWSAEIDPFASAVHAARFPGMPNLGNVEGIDADAIEPVDLVVFGSPCQSFSVAGRRLGLDDPRGNLALVALRLVERLRPRWFVFENVPGLLSSDGGRDFGAFLGTVEQCGYGWAYRTLDAQFAGVPQRRRRVFVVGHFGSWQSAAAVLFEPESLRGDTAPRREAGERTPAKSLCGSDGGIDREDRHTLIPAVADPISCSENRTYTHEGTTFRGHNLLIDGQNATTLGDELCGTLQGEGMARSNRGFMVASIPILEAGARTGKSTTDPRAGIGIGEPGDPMFTVQSGKQHAVATPLTLAIRGRGDSHDLEYRDDGIANAILTPNGGRAGIGVGAVAQPIVPVQCNGTNVGTDLPSLRAGNGHLTGGGPAVAFQENQQAEITLSDVAKSLNSGGGKPGQGYPAVLMNGANHASAQEADARTLLRELRQQVGAEAFAEWRSGILDSLQCPEILRQAMHGCGIRRAAREAGRWLDDGALPCSESLPNDALRSLWQDGPDGCSPQGRELAQQLAEQSGTAMPVLSHQNSPPLSVRRLTPREAERLQGFPDDFTAVTYRGKPAADGPRYRALGNSMAVPVIGWVLGRIRAFEERAER
jgi:DNA (cytosine-5)-methyltransferase 1